MAIYLFLAIFLALGQLSSTVESRRVGIAFPDQHNEIRSGLEHAYEFVPVGTIVGFGFTAFVLVGVWILRFITSSDQYMLANRYDLVMYKIPTDPRSLLGLPKKVFVNTTAIQHNLTAARACGFEVSSLNKRFDYEHVHKLQMFNINTSFRTHNHKTRIRSAHRD